MAKKYPSRELDKFILRLPDGMRDAIAASAKANNRTMNAEIILRLQKSFAVDPPEARRNLPLVGQSDEGDEALPEGLLPLDEFVRDTAGRIYKELKENLGKRIVRTSPNAQRKNRR